jgi:hypothetical protein
MKKIFIIINAIMTTFITACALFYPSSYNDKNWGADTNIDPFAEIGRVVKFEWIKNTDVSDLEACISNLELKLDAKYGSNAFIIAFDFSQSALKPSEYVNHIPVVIGSLGYISNLCENTVLEWWGYPFDNPTHDCTLTPWKYNINIYYIILAPVNYSDFDIFDTNMNTNMIVVVSNNYETNIGRTDMFQIYMKLGNYLDTPDGIAAYTNNFWNIFGYQYLAYGANYVLNIKNSGGCAVIDELSIDPYSSSMLMLKLSEGVYYSPSSRGIGFKVNQSVADWSLQGAGNGNSMPAGTRLRIIWNDVQTNAPIGWTNGWPSNAIIEGNRNFFFTNYTDHADSWTTTECFKVLVDLERQKAVVDLFVSNESPSYFMFKMANLIGENIGGGEYRTHNILLQDKPIDGAYTIYVTEDFPE